MWVTRKRVYGLFLGVNRKESISSFKGEIHISSLGLKRACLIPSCRRSGMCYLWPRFCEVIGDSAESRVSEISVMEREITGTGRVLRTSARTYENGALEALNIHSGTSWVRRNLHFADWDRLWVRFEKENQKAIDIAGSLQIPGCCNLRGQVQTP